MPMAERTESALRKLAHSLGVEFFTLAEAQQTQPDFSRISRQDAQTRGVAAVSLADGTHRCLIADPADDTLLSWLAVRVGHDFTWSLAEPKTIRTLTGGAAESPSSAVDVSTGRSVSAVVAFVDAAVEGAWRLGASDIHFETRRDGLAVKYRIDGVLEEALRWQGTERPEEVLSRLKVLSQLDIAERRVPQDGRFTQTLGQRPVDVRVSIMPNAFGEDAVLRLLDKRHLLIGRQRMTLDALGFDGANLERIRDLSGRPHGMLLVTGPTGSGKTTTVYSVLSETMATERKVITIEDPIEYELGEVLQIPVNEAKGLTFARGLRSILRHDPDTIFIGEIRDPETADIAVQAALTGHLVFTTVHANNVFDVLGRFLHMRVDLFSLMSALNGVVSQRLVRRLCPACGGLKLGTQQRTGAGVAATHGRDVGCKQCRFTGYTGRTVVGEVLIVDDRFRELVVSRAPVSVLKSHARKLMGETLREEANALAHSGVTSLAEVNRVVAED